jgi:ParB family chromosome partitioning protein
MSEERLKRTGEVFLVPVEKIVVSDEINAARIDFGNLDELANSIEESGLKIPLLVKKNKGEDTFVLIQGKRRFKAIQILLERGVEFAGVKCFVAPQNYSIENSLFDQIILNDGKPYTNLEQGIVFSQLTDRGYVMQDIAKKVGKSITHISNCIEMSALPKKVRDLVADGSVSGHTAVELSRVVTSEEALIEAIEQAVAVAAISLTGEKKKVTKKNIQQIASLSPLKKLEEVKRILKEEGIQNDSVSLFEKIISRLKANENVESLVELFR